jgi:hypothetical protein
MMQLYLLEQHSVLKMQVGAFLWGHCVGQVERHR